MSSSPIVYQVSDLTDEMRRLMETSYPDIWIEGELSSLSTPASGHLYFSLKDERSQLRCAMFKGRASGSRYRPKVGDLVRVRAKISVYTARGDLQCIVQHIEEAGEGLLQRRYEELKQKLDREGLFSQALKKAIPGFAKHIGVITSPSGAAVRDIITTLNRRCPGIPVTIYPAVVQGETAAPSIISALRDAVGHQQCDVLLISRGGGSLEDLWCFNHEAVAREIARCPIPIVSGVGHEVDVTIADLVSDLRAPTPTAAAEMLSPDTDQLIAGLNSIQFRLSNGITQRLQRLAQNVDMTARQLVHPKQQLSQKSEKLLLTQQRLYRSIVTDLSRRFEKNKEQRTRLILQTPYKRIHDDGKRTLSLGQRLLRVQSQRLKSAQQNISALSGQLNAVSPLATLDRGYSIARDKNSDIVRSTDQTKPKDRLKVEVSNGILDCEVLQVEPN